MIVLPITTVCFWWHFRPNQINNQNGNAFVDSANCVEMDILGKYVKGIHRSFTTQFHMKTVNMINCWLPDTSCCHCPEYRCVRSNWNYTEPNGQPPTNQFATSTKVHFVCTTKLRNTASVIRRKVTIFAYIKIPGAFRGNYISLSFFPRILFGFETHQQCKYSHFGKEETAVAILNYIMLNCIYLLLSAAAAAATAATHGNVTSFYA